MDHNLEFGDHRYSSSPSPLLCLSSSWYLASLNPYPAIALQWREGSKQPLFFLPALPKMQCSFFTFDLSPLFPVAQWMLANGIYLLPIFWVWITVVTNMDQITLKWPRSSPRWMRCSGELELEGKHTHPALPQYGCPSCPQPHLAEWQAAFLLAALI